MPDNNTKLYFPVRKKVSSVLDPNTTSYNSEVITSNPSIRDEKTTKRNSGNPTGSAGTGGY